MSKLKLLTRKDNALENKELGIRLRLGFVLPEHVAEIQGFFRISSNPSTRIALYALRECVSEVEVDGERHDPRQLSYNIDTTDSENQPFLLGVAALIVEHLLVSDDVKKKSGSEPLPTTPENDAETVLSQ